MRIDIHAYVYRKPVPFVVPFNTVAELTCSADPRTLHISETVFNKITREMQ